MGPETTAPPPPTCTLAYTGKCGGPNGEDAFTEYWLGGVGTGQFNDVTSVSECYDKCASNQDCDGFFLYSSNCYLVREGCRDIGTGNARYYPMSGCSGGAVSALAFSSPTQAVGKTGDGQDLGDGEVRFATETRTMSERDSASTGLRNTLIVSVVGIVLLSLALVLMITVLVRRRQEAVPRVTRHLSIIEKGALVY